MTERSATFLDHCLDSGQRLKFKRRFFENPTSRESPKPSVKRGIDPEPNRARLISSVPSRLLPVTGFTGTLEERRVAIQ
jgi:hypothetical protein